MTPLRVNTTAYQFAHGKSPRGSGYWAFQFRGADGKLVRAFAGATPTDPTVFWAPGERRFVDAKGWAREKARAIGAIEIIVCS